MPFKPGQSGNPGGRPRVVGHVRDLAQAHIDKCVTVLIDLLASENENIRLAAARELLDRGCGKPAAVDEEKVIREELAKMTDEALEALHAAEQQKKLK